MARLDAGVPTSPLTDPLTGIIAPEWRAFFNALWLRTGGGIGQSTDTTALEAQLEAEATIRAQADTNLGHAIDAEAVARQEGDAAVAASASAAVAQEAVVRQQGDANVATLIYQTAQGWQQADADLVPKAQLCTLWAACDLSFLPRSDPGHGMPWLNDNTLSVGTSASASDALGLEAGSDQWVQEDGTDLWVWG